MSIDPGSHVPIYEQIAETIRTRISAGIYRPGDALPSLRGMALEVVVNPNTVQRAYEALEREGLAYSRRGVGLFVTDEAVQIARGRGRAELVERLREDIAAARAAGISEATIRESFQKAMAQAP